MQFFKKKQLYISIFCMYYFINYMYRSQFTFEPFFVVPKCLAKFISFQLVPKISVSIHKENE